MVALFQPLIEKNTEFLEQNVAKYYNQIKTFPSDSRSKSIGSLRGLASSTFQESWKNGDRKDANGRTRNTVKVGRTNMVCLSAGALTVRYSKLRDRLSHTIGIVDGNAYLPLLESIEGSEEQPWPVSPPMQQMVEECFTPGTNPVLLGVGMSGNGHWSTAIESRHDQQLKFDIACKNSKSSTFLGSKYRVLTCVQQSPRPNTIEIMIEPIKLLANIFVPRIEFDVSIGRLEFSNAERQICVTPNSASSSIQTHRWCYEISLFIVG